MWVAPNFLIAGHIKFLMERRWAKLQRDDKMLEKEGFGDLTRLELEKACQMRGMRWVDNSDALADQLQGWVDLSVNAAIPYHTLFFVKPTANNLADSIRSCPVDARRKLLGMQRLPREVQDALDRICDNVEPKDAETLEQSESTIALARRVEKIERDVMKSSTVDDLEVKRAIAEHFATEAVRDNCWKSIHDKYNGKVTVSTAVECVASAIHQSTHSVSNVFDGFEMGEGGKELAPTAFAALIARCRDDVAAAQEAQKAKQAADQHGHPAEDKKKK
jgi:LETM1 and EF-hand domain-containing protein 1